MEKESEEFTRLELMNLLKKVSQPFRWAFWSACVCGIITHLYMFTNLILNHDSVWRLYYANDNLELGRWLLKALSEFSTRFQMPVVIGLISVLALAMTAGLTVSVLEISSKPMAMLTGAFIVTMPSVACIFSYLYTADAYFICLFLNALAVYLAKRYRWGWLLAIILCALACGGYQAFICYAIGLLLIDCILDLLKGGAIAQAIKKGVKYIFVIGASLVVYYLVLIVLLNINGVAMSSYQGLDSVVDVQVGNLIKQIPAAYVNFFKYFKSIPSSGNIFQILQGAFLLLGLVALIYMTYAKRLYRGWARMVLLVVGIVLLPLALNFITVLSMGAKVHALMIYSFILLDLLMMKLIECAAQQMTKKELAARREGALLVGTILAGMLVWNNFCVSNMAYLRLQVCYENSFALANRITARIETVEDYSAELPVAVVGEASRKLYGGTIKEFSMLNALTGTNDGLLYSAEPHIRTRTFIEQYIGIRMPKPSNEQKAKLRESEFVKAMPCYPQEGSVVNYEGIIVVKLSEGEVR